MFQAFLAESSRIELRVLDSLVLDVSIRFSISAISLSVKIG